MAKLTLSVDKRVIDRAKRYAHARGTSVSRFFESVVLMATDESAGVSTPVLARLRGSLRHADVAAYRQALERKYR